MSATDNGMLLRAGGVMHRYGDLTAVNDVSLAVRRGEVFGLLGPNGAGKSTLIGILCGMFAPTAGNVHLGDVPITPGARSAKRRIGVVPQDIALYEKLSGRQNLRFFGRVYGLGGRRLRERVEAVLDVVGLSDRGNDQAGTYSGGMQRRLNLAAGLLHEPELLVLDEPTVGVDPQSRNHIFDNVERLNRDQGVTIVLYDALHGRGRAAVRPGGDHRSREDRGAGYAAGTNRLAGRRGDPDRDRSGAASGR